MMMIQTTEQSKLFYGRGSKLNMESVEQSVLLQAAYCTQGGINAI